MCGLVDVKPGDVKPGYLWFSCQLRWMAVEAGVDREGGGAGANRRLDESATPAE